MCNTALAFAAGLTFISQTIRRWTLNHPSVNTLQELAKVYNPYIQGWINYW